MVNLSKAVSLREPERTWEIDGRVYEPLVEGNWILGNKENRYS